MNEISNVACRNCAGTGWVCENHRDYPWAGLTNGAECCGGAGAPCGACNLEIAFARYVDQAIAADRFELENGA